MQIGLLVSPCISTPFPRLSIFFAPLNSYDVFPLTSELFRWVHRGCSFRWINPMHRGAATVVYRETGDPIYRNYCQIEYYNNIGRPWPLQSFLFHPSGCLRTRAKNSHFSDYVGTTVIILTLDKKNHSKITNPSHSSLIRVTCPSINPRHQRHPGRSNHVAKLSKAYAWQTSRTVLVCVHTLHTERRPVHLMWSEPKHRS